MSPATPSTTAAAPTWASGSRTAKSDYLDERSTNCVVEKNFSLNVGWPSHNHMATNNVIRQNVFIVAGDAKLTFPRSIGYALDGNVIYATGKIAIQNPAAVAAWSNNLFYSAAGKIEFVELRDYSRIASRDSKPGGIVVADPLFVNLSAGDYRYQPGSPAQALNLQPIDPGRAGRLHDKP
ncbi:MAG: hypothetical protein HY735_34055 [Verrucomicrobia bacterium]|nr:hypothetical protein [Verrucomicrobiota bacterium]